MWPVQHHLEKRYGNLSFLLVYEATIATALRSMVIEGYGVAWVPLSIVVDDLESGCVVRAGDENDEIRLDINIYRHSNFIAPQAEKFWRVLEQRPDRIDG